MNRPDLPAGQLDFPESPHNQADSGTVHESRLSEIKINLTDMIFTLYLFRLSPDLIRQVMIQFLRYSDRQYASFYLK